jgi:hypothetical protein
VAGARVVVVGTVVVAVGGGGGGVVVEGAVVVAGAAAVVGGMMSAKGAGDAATGVGPTIMPIPSNVTNEPRSASGNTTHRRRRSVEFGRVKPVSHMATATHSVTGQNSIATTPTTTPMTIHLGCPGYLLTKSTG